MAYIRKLPSGKWNAIVRHPSGKRLSKTDQLKRVVADWAAAKEAEFRSGPVPAGRDRRLTVEAWHERWAAARNVEPSTARKDASQIRTHVLPRWGDWPLQSIGRLDVQTWVKDMTHAGVGPSTVTGAYHRFAAMMSDAVLEGVLAASPCQGIDLPKVARPAPRFLTRHEYDRIQLALANRTLTVPHSKPPRTVDDPDALTWQAYVAVACFSGLRPGELAGLDVEHIDFDRSLIYAGRQVLTRDGLRDYGKSESATRAVPFPAEVGDLLWRLVGDRGSGPVFLTSRGGRVRETNFRDRVWQPALEAAGVQYARPYITRHTAASWLVQAGVPPIEVVRMLGHSSMALVNTYLHLAPEQHDRIRAAWATSDPQVTHAAQTKSPTSG